MLRFSEAFRIFFSTSARAAAQACRPHDIFFQDCSILDRNSPRVDGSLKLFKASDFTPDVCLMGKPREGDSHEGHVSLVHLDSSGCDSTVSIDQQLCCLLAPC